MLNVKKMLTTMLSGISGSNNCLRLGNVALCWGVVDLAGITANEFRTGSVTYPCVFASNPSTVMSVRDSSPSPQYITWEVYSNSTSSFTWAMKSTYSGNWGSSHAYWIAIGLIGGGVLLKGILTPCRKVVGVC
jgi:hypothetical protein